MKKILYKICSLSLICSILIGCSKDVPQEEVVEDMKYDLNALYENILTASYKDTLVVNDNTFITAMNDWDISYEFDEENSTYSLPMSELEKSKWNTGYFRYGLTARGDGWYEQEDIPSDPYAIYQIMDFTGYVYFKSKDDFYTFESYLNDFLSKKQLDGAEIIDDGYSHLYTIEQLNDGVVRCVAVGLYNIADSGYDDELPEGFVPYKYGIYTGILTRLGGVSMPKNDVEIE